MKVFMFNHSGSLNRGCEAIIKGTIAILNEAYGENEYILSSYSPGEDGKISDLASILSFEPKKLNVVEHIIAALNIRIKNDERYSVLKRYSTFFKDARFADICLSVGGDTYCYGDNSVIRIITEELNRRGKKTILWGASIGKEDLTAEKEKNLACFDAIFARESLSFNLINEKKLNPNVFLFPDPAFVLHGEELPLPMGWQEKNTVGINISPIVAGRNPRIFEIISSFIKRILRETDMSVALIPHVTSQANNDMTLLEKLFNENKSKSNRRLLILPADLTAEQYKGYIARLRYFIGARTHATIAAYTNCVPTIVLGYSVKSKGIALDLFGDERFVINTGNLQSGDELYDTFEALREQENDIISICKSIMPDMIKKAYSAGIKLRDILR